MVSSWTVEALLKDRSALLVEKKDEPKKEDAKSDDKPAEPLGVGQTLPSGEKILQIDSERLCILINGKRRSLEIRTR